MAGRIRLLVSRLMFGAVNVAFSKMFFVLWTRPVRYAKMRSFSKWATNWYKVERLRFAKYYEYLKTGQSCHDRDGLC